MQLYRTVITVDDPNQIVLNNVPVQPGDRVEIVVRAESDQKPDVAESAKQLLQMTHALPQLESSSEADIAAEMAAFRNGQ